METFLKESCQRWKDFKGNLMMQNILMVHHMMVKEVVVHQMMGQDVVVHHVMLILVV